MHLTGNLRRATILLAVAGLAGAQAAKVDFATLLGAGKFAKVVWQKQANGLPVQFDAPNDVLMAYDSKVGTVRTLVGGATAKTDPTFTWDGARVVYFMPNSNQIGVVNFDGTNNVTISGSYDGGGHCWRSGTTDYVLAVQGSNLYKVNIDQPSSKTLVYTGTSSGDGSGVTWASMSPSGNKIAGVFPNYPNVGIANTGASSYTKTNPGGCWPTIARDGSDQVLYTIEPHTNVRIVASNGTTQVLNKELTGIWNDGGASEYECLRWTNDIDILSCISYDEGAGVCKGANPKIVRISTLQWASPNTGVSGSEGNTDVYVYSATGTTTPLSRAFVTNGIASSPERFDLRGRLVSDASDVKAGVYLVGDVTRFQRQVVR